MNPKYYPINLHSLSNLFGKSVHFTGIPTQGKLQQKLGGPTQTIHHPLLVAWHCCFFHMTEKHTLSLYMAGQQEQHNKISKIFLHVFMFCSVLFPLSSVAFLVYLFLFNDGSIAVVAWILVGYIFYSSENGIWMIGWWCDDINWA